MARLALWDVFAEDGDHAGACRGVAGRLIPPGPTRKVSAGLSLLTLSRNDEAFAAFAGWPARRRRRRR